MRILLLQYCNLSSKKDIEELQHFLEGHLIRMCCGFETLAMDNEGDVQKLISSAIRKKKFNRNRRHPSMCVDAVLTSTIKLLRNDDLIQQILKFRTLKRPSSFSTTRPKRKRSRWDMKTREPINYEMDEELDELTGMKSFFQKLKEVSCESQSDAFVSVGD